MQGYHEVKVFVTSTDGIPSSLTLPEGWKPFAAYPHSLIPNRLNVVARKWHRSKG